MSSIRLPNRPLIVDTVRGHRWGIVAWAVGGAVAMIIMGAALARERARFPGGPEARATSVMPGAEAMRLLRWPAERLDTLGGYLTYHNVTVFLLALSVYGAVQGANAGITHKRTRPYTPRTNGKVERYNRTMLVEWAYARPYPSEAARRRAFTRWQHIYNHHRPHSALRGHPPISRVTNLRGQYT